MKKFLSFALVLAMLASALSMTACGSSNDVTTDGKPSNPPSSSDPASSASTDSSNPAETTGNTPDSNPTTGNEQSIYRYFEAVDNLEAFKTSYTNLIQEYYDNGYNTEFSIATGHDYTGEEYSDYYRYGTTELPPSLFDLDPATKWCSIEDPCYDAAIIWEMTQAVEVIGYIITTGDDNLTQTRRNPIAWRLYGSNEAPTVRMDSENPETGGSYLLTETVPAGWTLIDAVDASDPNNYFESLLPDNNMEEVGTLVSNPGRYKYFMLVFDYTESYTLQMGEFTLYGNAD